MLLIVLYNDCSSGYLHVMLMGVVDSALTGTALRTTKTNEGM